MPSGVDDDVAVGHGLGEVLPGVVDRLMCAEAAHIVMVHPSCGHDDPGAETAVDP